MDPTAGSAVTLPATIDTAMLPSIVLTVSTHDRLALLISLLRGENGDDLLEFLDQEVARAELVDDRELDGKVAELGRHIRFRDNLLGIDRCATLAYPGHEQQISDGLSVLTPEGACLIGLSEGQSMRYWQGAQPVCDVTLCAVSP
jgi:regulator of nucleoside diphosphate kinase